MFHRDLAILGKTPSFSAPPGAGPARPGAGPRGQCEVLYQPRRHPRNSRPAILWDPGPRPERDKLPDPGSRPPPPAHGLSGGSGCSASRRLSRPPRASGAPATSPPPAGPPRGCASCKLPPGAALLPAFGPAPGGPERRVIGPARAVSLRPASPLPCSPTAPRPAVVLVLAGPRRRVSRCPVSSDSPAGRRASPAARCSGLRGGTPRRHLGSGETAGPIFGMRSRRS